MKYELQYQARPVWLQLHRREVLSLDQYKHPNVIAEPYLSRSVMDKYIVAEGLSGLAYVAETDECMYLAMRRMGGSPAWVCYELGKQTKQYEVLFNAIDLADVKQKLSQVRPECRSQAVHWGTSGAKVINPMDYGAYGDGKTDDYDAFIRALRTATSGDVLFLPADKTFRLRQNVYIPQCVRVDCRKGAIMVKPDV